MSAAAVAGGETPSPVREVRRYEADLEAAKRLQQLYEDEQRAAQMEEEHKVEDEFDAATAARNEQLNEEAVKEILGDSNKQ